MADFTHFVHISVDHIYVGDCPFKESYKCIGKLNVKYFPHIRCLINGSFKNNEIKKTISEWFNRGIFLAFDTVDNDALLNDCYNVFHVTKGVNKYLIRPLTWSVGFKNKQLIISNYHVEDFRYFAFITGSQADYLLQNYDAIHTYTTCRLEFPLYALNGIIKEIGDIFIYYSDTYNVIAEINKPVEQVESVKIEQVTKPVEVVEIKPVEQVISVVEVKPVEIKENLSDKYAKMAYEVYLKKAEKLFDINETMELIKKNSAVGHLGIFYEFHNYSIAAAFSKNSKNPFRDEIIVIIKAMYEAFKTKLELEGFKVWIEKDEKLFVEPGPSQAVIDELIKKYVK